MELLKHAAGLLIYLHLIATSGSTPITVEETDFTDPWDFALEPHNQPLLKETSKNHLPLLLKREGKSHDMDLELDKDYDLQDINEKPKDITSRLTCPSCKLGVTLLRREVEKGSSFEEIREKFIAVCVGLKIEVEPVCAGAFDIYGPVVLPALKMSELDSEKICSLLLGEACGLVENPTHIWDVALDERPPGNIWDSPSPEADAPVFKVLHISDTHFDPQYVEGSPANCNEPLCCRSYSTQKEDAESIPAGKWGSYGSCDIPQSLFENTLENIAKQHPDIDYVIWTGDIPPHDVWNQTKEQNIDNIKYTTQKMLEAFPNIPIFPSLGNHESIPAGNFPPPWIKSDKQSIEWLYDVIAEEWNKWLPQDVNSSVIHGAFYSVLVRPKFRIISINTNYCYALSWWLVLNSTDPAHELKWLVHELQNAENKGEKVHIIGHIPPGENDCFKVWSKNYYDIINRFKNTVVAQFFGHTHNDEFEVFYDNDDFTADSASAVAFIGPSVTTFEDLNPGYRIYYVDGDRDNSTREVIDHETWIMDLGKANSNLDEDPTWYKLYSARDMYGMSTLRPKEWAKLIDLMAENEDLFLAFYRLMYKASPTRPPCKENQCRFKILCNQKTGKSHERLRICKHEEDILLPRKDSR